MTKKKKRIKITLLINILRVTELQGLDWERAEWIRLWVILFSYCTVGKWNETL